MLDSRDIRLVSVYILIPAFLILIFTVLGVASEVGRAGILNTAVAARQHLDPPRIPP